MTTLSEVLAGADTEAARTPQIVEPFFTTKEHGTGTGLAIRRTIVESRSGRLWGENNEPVGAKFIFTLPIEAKTVP
jgi:signal transduction histidine kinase